MLRHNTSYYLKFVLLFVLIFFIITYSVTHRETILTEIEIVTLGSSIFAKTATDQLLNFGEESSARVDKNTYEIEILVHKQINQIRLDEGYNELKWDPMLANLARSHSMEMALGGYLNHTNLQGLNPTQRADSLGIKTTLETKNFIYRGIGENIGFMPSGIVKNVGVLIIPQDIGAAMVLQWMLSKPHKENILKNDYRYTGIGVVYDGKGNYYLTQNFQ